MGGDTPLSVPPRGAAPPWTMPTDDTEMCWRYQPKLYIFFYLFVSADFALKNVQINNTQHWTASIKEQCQVRCSKVIERNMQLQQLHFFWFTVMHFCHSWKRKQQVLFLTNKLRLRTYTKINCTSKAHVTWKLLFRKRTLRKRKEISQLRNANSARAKKFSLVCKHNCAICTYCGPTYALPTSAIRGVFRGVIGPWPSTTPLIRIVWKFHNKNAILMTFLWF